MKNFAVPVQNEEESRTVQSRFFMLGIPWSGGSYNTSTSPIDHEGSLAAIGCRPNENFIRFSYTSHYRRMGWAILSIEKFFTSYGGQVMMLIPRGVR